ncbi:tyrosine-type recombinase/integrase [Limnohabitans sp. Hippo4]|uniref:tyrosine-type recombinase/integrase n=1 Tax=Limnohabitans sp. Hippo4 TaxID=1826167 RepID=UPI003513B0CB
MWFLRISLFLNRFLQRQKKVVQTKQRKHTFTQVNTTFGVKAMSQARVLTERELRKVLNYCSTQPHATRNRAMLLCTHMAGMRVGEVAALRICDVLGADGAVMDEIALAACQTKGNNSRTVLVPKKLQEELSEYLQERFGLKDLLAVTLTDTQRALFPTQKNPKRGFTANTLCQLFHKIYKDSRMTGATSHSGRRTFITKLADKGVGVRVLMALAGHKSIATTQRYIELNPTVMKAAVELI